MLFLSFNNANVRVMELEKLFQRFYNTTEALFTTSQVELINKKGFAKIALDKNSENFIMHVVVLKVKMPIFFLSNSHSCIIIE